MMTFQAAASEYLTAITSTHTPSTMRTYHRNFEVLLVPFFGADTPLADITSEIVAAFHASEALLRKPNGQPRAEPTKDQITGLLRSFLTHAATNGLLPALPNLPARSRRTVVRLCDRCRAPLTDGAAVAPPSVVPAEPVTPTPSIAPAPGTSAGQATSKRSEKKVAATQPAARPAPKRAGKRR